MRAFKLCLVEKIQPQPKQIKWCRCVGRSQAQASTAAGTFERWITPQKRATGLTRQGS
jgi:hypothetical protein